VVATSPKLAPANPPAATSAELTVYVMVREHSQRVAIAGTQIGNRYASRLFAIRVRAESPDAPGGDDQGGDAARPPQPGLGVLSPRSLALATGQLLDTWSGLRDYSAAPPDVTIQYGSLLRIGLISVAELDKDRALPKGEAFIDIPLERDDSVRIWLPEDPDGLLGDSPPQGGDQVIRYLHRSAQEGFR
jgi:hypothetical protein